MIITQAQSSAWEIQTEALINQKKAQTGEGFCDFEIRPISGTGGFEDQAAEALEFRYEHFGMKDAQAVSCQNCGGLFVERLSVMRSHRLTCGWT